MDFLQIAKNKKSAETTPSTTTPAAPAVEYKNELNIAINANPPSLDVPAVNSNIVGGIGSHIYELLFAMNANYEPTAVLAEGYEVSAEWENLQAFLYEYGAASVLGHYSGVIANNAKVEGFNYFDFPLYWNVRVPA